MDIYQIRVKVYMLQSICVTQLNEVIGHFIDSALAKSDEFLTLHNQNVYKQYVFDGFYPVAQTKVYGEGKVYTLTIRTIDQKLAKYFKQVLANHYNDQIKGLTTEVKQISSMRIRKLYSVNAIILKTENGYWRNTLSLSEFEQRIQSNLLNKYRQWSGVTLNSDIRLIRKLTIANEKPVSVYYKKKKFLGDKIDIEISSDPISQDLANFALAVGVGELNARGAGFMNWK